MSSNSTEKKL